MGSLVNLVGSVMGVYQAGVGVGPGACEGNRACAVQAVGGGKLQVLLGSLPRSGAHALAARDGNAGPKTAMSLMQPQGKDYDSLADAAAEAQVLQSEAGHLACTLCICMIPSALLHPLERCLQVCIDLTVTSTHRCSPWHCTEAISARNRSTAAAWRA